MRLALDATRGIVTSQQLAKHFTRARVDRIEELLQTLVSLGRAREVGAGRSAVSGSPLSDTFDDPHHCVEERRFI